MKGKYGSKTRVEADLPSGLGKFLLSARNGHSAELRSQSVLSASSGLLSARLPELRQNASPHSSYNQTSIRRESPTGSSYERRDRREG